MIIALLSVFCLSFIYLFYRFFRNTSTIPEGLKELPLEKGYPILGVLPQIEPPQHRFLAKLSNKHGPLFRIRVGFRDVVVLNNYDVIKKTLKDNGNAFSGRLTFLWFAIVARDSGILFIDGDTWAKQRSFILSVLRDFGMGKSRSQEIVQSECLYLIDELRNLVGTSVDFGQTIPIYTANIISKFIMSKRFTRDDPNFQGIEEAVKEFLRKKDSIFLIQMMFPFFDYSKVFDKMIMAFTTRFQIFDKSHSYFQSEIEEHRKRLDLNSEGENLIERFLKKQHEMKQKHGSVDTFTEWQLIRNAFELCGAGFETTSTTLGWSMFFMSKFQDVQEKVHLEIIDKIGSERMPTMNDKVLLNYSQAVIDEIMRAGSIVPIAIFHRTLEDTNVNGYFIPKDSLVFPNLYACHYDPITWDNPMEFKPERFLSVDNNGELKYSPREELISFSMGKRQCAGESLARMEIFIFFISIFQNFKVSFSEEISENQYEEVLRAQEGFVRFSKIKDFIFKSRH